MPRRRPIRPSMLGTAASVALLPSLLLIVGGCDSSAESINGPQRGGGSANFEVDSVNVLNGSLWQLNRPIEISFNRDINFDTVSLSTIQIVDNQGVPAVGSFTEIDARTVSFQPVCPTDEFNANGGLLQGRQYRLTVPAESGPGLGGGVTVETTAGARLEDGVNLSFQTPSSPDSVVLFVDTMAGPPQVRLQTDFQTPAENELASFVEVDRDGDGELDDVFIRFDTNTQTGGLVDGEPLPLNFYSRPEEQFAFVLRFNQAVAGGPSNINSDLLGLEYQTALGAWIPIASTVTLESNCTPTGATVRLTPEGILPRNAMVRAVVREGFSDLTGDRVPASVNNFALAMTEGLGGGIGADEAFERFDFGGDEAGSLEDLTVASSNPRALWASDESPGTLRASFAFGGTGGPGGNFSWRIDNEEVILNTDSDVIFGGPDFATNVPQPIVGGVINVTHFEITDSGRLTIVGSNPCTILATGNVRINGPITVDGGDSVGVINFDTTDEPELGAPGNGGGGDGGDASILPTQSSSRGGRGEGAFGVANGGGFGGETGFAPAVGACFAESRRGAGGGGGRFGPDIRYRSPDGNLVRCQMLVGMDAERGFFGSLDGTGAISQSLPPQGGAAGPLPFLDGDDSNNFFGKGILADGRQVIGELPSLWAGAGGGGAGDAVENATFPLTPFSDTGDEKGAAGGGGAGGIQILAIGNIVIDTMGSISADGGHGGGGEGESESDRLGGGSGGGSGGHILLTSAASIIVRAEASGLPTVGAFYEDDPNVQARHVRRPLSALGGQGGEGRGSGAGTPGNGGGRCGAGSAGQTRWNLDSIPTEAFEGDVSVPPRNEENAATWAFFCSETEQCATNFPAGETPGAGGDGGPGLIQLHVTDPATQLIFDPTVALEGDPDSDLPTQLPVGYIVPNPYVNGTDPTTGNTVTGVDPTRACAPPPVGWTEPMMDVARLAPFFSTTSEAYSQWISLGLARVNPAGMDSDLEFLFDGTDVGTGAIDRLNGTGSAQEPLTALVDFTDLSLGGASPSLDGATFTFARASVADPNGVYRQNPALMHDFAIQLRDDTNNTVVQEFVVQSAVFDELNDNFLLTVESTNILGQSLSAFANAQANEVALIPYFFRLINGSVRDFYPVGTEVRISFDAAVADENGQPDPELQLSGGNPSNFTPDIGVVNAGVPDGGGGFLAPDFVRFKVEFLIDPQDPQFPALDFLRLPFRF